jgi:hypothetical protein
MRPPVGFGTLTRSPEAVTEKPSVPICSMTSMPSCWSTKKTGIVISSAPSTVGLMRPGALFYMITAVAPAFCALSAFV